jgi:thioredoxin 1
LHGEDNSVQYDIDDIKSNSNARHKGTPAAPILLTDSSFKQAVKKYPVLVVDFWAPWCGPCRMLSPIIEQLASEMAGKAVFGKLNVDENSVIAMEFEVQSIPTVIVFKNGDLADGFRGVAPKPEIRRLIENVINA